MVLNRIVAAGVVSLVLAAGGCASTRQALGLYKRTADKGVVLGGGTADGVASPGSAGSETTPAPAGKRQREGKAAKLNLPTGLGGDKEHHAYTSDTPK